MPIWIDGFDVRRRPADLRTVTEADFPRLGVLERRLAGEMMPMMDEEHPDEEHPKPMKIRGYAAVFGQVADMYWWKEQVAPGAFAKSLARKDEVKALFNHDPSQILGCSRAGTLTLREDGHGLYYEIDPPDSPCGCTVVAALKRKDITKSSFGFRVKRFSLQRYDDGSPPLRTLEELDLFDVSPVTWPAYQGTSSEARSMDPELFERVAALLERWERGDRPEKPSRALSSEADHEGRAQLTLYRRRLELLELDFNFSRR